MNIPNKKTGSQFDNFGNKVEARMAEAKPVVTALAVMDLDAAETEAYKAFRELDRAGAKLSRMDRRLFDAFHAAIRKGGNGSMMGKTFTRLIRRDW